jgi:hypothetical protein
MEEENERKEREQKKKSDAVKAAERRRKKRNERTEEEKVRDRAIDEPVGALLSFETVVHLSSRIFPEPVSI